MNKIKKIAENVYYSIFNIVDYANYTFFHFFFGADIVTKVVGSHSRWSVCFSLSRRFSALP